MGKRGRRKRSKKKRSKKPPSNALKAMERGVAVIEEVSAGRPVEEIIDDRRHRLRELIAPYDAVHLLGNVLVAESPLDPNTYVESQHEGHAFVAELVAAEIILRADRAGVTEVEPFIDGNLIDAISQITHDAAIAESIRRRANVTEGTPAERSARGRAAVHHIMMRNPGWEWQEQETLRGLFGPQHLAIRLRETLGFDCDDALKCCEAIGRWIVEQISTHLSRARESATNFDESHPANIWADQTLSVKTGSADPELAVAITGLWAIQHVGEALLLSAETLSSVAGVDRQAAAAFLGEFSQRMAQGEAHWFAMAESVRLKPMVAIDGDAYFLTMPSNLIWAIRPLFDRVLKDDDAFERHRGRWLEDRAAKLLNDALRPDECHVSVDLSYIDESGQEVDGEIDVLVRLGDVAIVVEAKSTTMPSSARRGGGSLLDHLKRNLTKATNQGEKAREAIRRSGSLSVNGTPLELGSEIREIHPVVVTLDDFSAVAPVLWEFAGSRIMPEGVTIPWVVTNHELETVAETVEWPAQMIHFLRRRSLLNERGSMYASDELDWWMHYLLFGLYFDDDESSIRQSFLSLTDPLDSWMLFSHGVRQVPAQKPRLSLPEETRAFMNLLCDERPQGWVAAACSILEINTQSQEELWGAVNRLRTTANKRERVQRVTLTFEEGPEPMMVLAAAVPDGGGLRLSDVVAQLVAERVDEFGLRRTLAFGFEVSSERPYDALQVVERRHFEAPVAYSCEDTQPS